MSTEEYRRYLRERLAKLETQMQEARERLESGRPRDKVEAAGELAELERRHEEMGTKLEQLDGEPEGGLEAARVWFDEQATLLQKQINDWMARH